MTMTGLAILLALLATGGDVTAEGRLPAGAIVTPELLSGAPEDVRPLVGRQLKRTIFPGRTVSLADTKTPDLVDRNGMVRIVARKGPLVVETKGRALGAGGRGEEILVMNLDSRRTVTAIVTAAGTVEVDL